MDDLLPDTERQVIAIIDDDADQRLLLRRALELRGYRVLEFGSVEEALGWDEDQPDLSASPLSEADLLLLDIHLPGVSGADAISLLRESPTLKRLPVAMLTAARTSDMVRRCIQSGAIDYFIKPLEFKTVLPRIEALLEAPKGLLKRSAAVQVEWSFQDLLIRELKRAERTADPLSIIVAGLRPRGTQHPTDHETENYDLTWNLRSNYPAGLEEATAQLCKISQRHLREYDVIVPLGDSDFVILLPSTAAPGRDVVIRRIFDLTRSETALPHQLRQGTWSLFLGGVTAPDDGTDRLELLTTAENRVDLSPPPEPNQATPHPLLYPHTQRCLGCGDHFRHFRVLTRRLRPKDRESDFRLVYQDLDPLYYGAVTCPSCGLSFLDSDLRILQQEQDSALFGWEYTSRRKEQAFSRKPQTVLGKELFNHISPPYEAWSPDKVALPTWREVTKDLPDRDILLEEANLNSDEMVSVVAATARHILARNCYAHLGAAPLRRAKIAHRLAWLARELGEKEAESEWLEEALGFYQTAFHFENLSASRPSEIEILYLLGELAFRLNREADAVAVFERLVRDARTEDNEAFRKMVYRRWYEARHEPLPEDI